MDRRSVLSTTAAMGLGAVTGCATPGSANSGSRTVFPVAQPMLPIVGSSEMFPVRRIYCIGRNYAAHAREMGSDPNREPPFFFQKPSDAIQFVAPGTTADHPYPPLTKNYHYEIELVAALKSGGRNVSTTDALALVSGYAIGLDMTRRDLAESQWRRQAERQLESDDLERGRADQQAVASLRAEGRRHHLQRHAGERRPGRGR